MVVTDLRGRYGVKKQINLRVAETLEDRINTRSREVGVSRNEWLNRAITWALDQPRTSRNITRTHEEKV
jgi:predicted HicB family RNase H-like nuclease